MSKHKTRSHRLGRVLPSPPLLREPCARRIHREDRAMWTRYSIALGVAPGPVTPVALLDSPVVTVGGNIYLFGGVQGGAISAASFKFDGTTWTPIAPLPAAVEFPAAVTDGTDCYILGGALTGTGVPQTTLWRYNVASNTYTTLAPFTRGNLEPFGGLSERKDL